MRRNLPSIWRIARPIAWMSNVPATIGRLGKRTAQRLSTPRSSRFKGNRERGERPEDPVGVPRQDGQGAEGDGLQRGHHEPGAPRSGRSTRAIGVIGRAFSSARRSKSDRKSKGRNSRDDQADMPRIIADHGQRRSCRVPSLETGSMMTGKRIQRIGRATLEIGRATSRWAVASCPPGDRPGAAPPGERRHHRFANLRPDRARIADPSAPPVLRIRWI